MEPAIRGPRPQSGIALTRPDPSNYVGSKSQLRPRMRSQFAPEPGRRERNFWMRRRAAKNPRPNAPARTETKVQEMSSRMSPQKRPVWRSTGNVRFARAGWWCAQSDTNRSPLQIPLFSGNLTGDSAIFRPQRHFCIGEAAVLQWFFAKFPKKINRVKLSDNRDRNRTNSEIQSGYQ
jgi:hypothetical protein